MRRTYYIVRSAVSATAELLVNILEIAGKRKQRSANSVPYVSSLTTQLSYNNDGAGVVS